MNPSARHQNEKAWFERIKYYMIGLATLSLALSSFAAPLNVFTRRAMKITLNPAKEAYVDSAIALAKRGARAGYNLCFLECSRFFQLHKTGETQRNRIKRACSEIKKAGLHLMPSTLHQTEPVYTSKTNAEALPVRRTKFVVSNGIARAVDNPPFTFKNTGFEAWHASPSNMPKDWNPRQLSAGKNLFRDQNVIRPGTTGKSSVRIEIPKTSDPCLIQNINLKPWKAYRLSIWVKTKNVGKARGIGCEAYAGSRTFLCIRGTRGVKENQDWKKHSWEFCSLDATLFKVRIACAWAWPTTGTVWFDDLQIEEVGLAEIQTRGTTPVTVRSEDGKVYRAGKDYVVGKEKLTIPAGSDIGNGDILRVDWFRFADMEAIPATASFCHKESWDVLRNNVGEIFNLIGPVYGWHIRLSEWRVAYWDEACRPHYKNAAHYMGSTARKSADLLREFNSKIETHIWNSNFDPYHNAKEKYYLVNGSALGTWESMDPTTIISNWNGKRREETLRFFAGKDSAFSSVIPRKQVFSVLNGQVKPCLDILDRYEADFGEETRDMIVGVEYATWAVYGSNYSGLEFMANMSQKAGRWGTNPCPFENGCDYPPVPGPRVPDDSIGIKNDGKATQTSLSLGGSFNSSEALITYTIPYNSRVQLKIVNSKGQEISKIAGGKRQAGKHTVRWNGKIPTGVYFVRLSVEGPTTQSAVRRVVRL